MEEYLKNIAQKINNSNIIIIENRPITIEDVKMLKEYDIIQMKHSKGFGIQIRMEYVLKTVLNIPTVFHTDKLIISDEILGIHPFKFNQEEIVEYANSLLGY